MEMKTKFCLICCYSFNPGSGSSTMSHFRDYKNNRLLKFCEGLLPNLKSSLVLDEFDCLKLEVFGNVLNFQAKRKELNKLSLCNDCLSVIMIIVEGKSRVDQVEEQIRLLQEQGVRAMDKLCKEMRILEELMEGGDTQVLDDGGSPSCSHQINEIVTFRQDILKATKDLRAHGSNLSDRIASHNGLCNCGANIHSTVPVTEEPSNTRLHNARSDCLYDPSNSNNEDIVPEDVKLFNGEDPSSPLQEASPFYRSDLGDEEDEGGISSANSYDDDNKSVKRNSNNGNKMIRPKKKSVLVLKILKKAKAKHPRRLHTFAQCGGAGRPRDPIRNEFDVERVTGKAKCRMCERVLSCRVDVMKSHKLCCPARRNRDSCSDERDFGNAGRLTEIHSKPAVERTDSIEIPEIKTHMSKYQGKGTSRGKSKSKVPGRPRDSIRNEFDLTETGKAKCRDCNRSIFYRVDVMKSHKLACLSNPNYGGQAELELDELTGELRPAGSKRRRNLRRKPGATPRTAGRPKDSIRNEFELTDTGKAKCKNCNFSITYRVDVMKKHKMCCRQKKLQLSSHH